MHSEISFTAALTLSLLIQTEASLIEHQVGMSSQMERQKEVIQPQLKEKDPNPYKFHFAIKCAYDADCERANGGCNHTQYVGDIVARSNGVLPRCFKPSEDKLQGVCICPECVNDLDCTKSSRCPYSLNGKCDRAKVMPVCICGSAKRSMIVRQSVFSFWGELLCENLLLRNLLTGILC